MTSMNVATPFAATVDRGSDFLPSHDSEIHESGPRHPHLASTLSKNSNVDGSTTGSDGHGVTSSSSPRVSGRGTARPARDPSVAAFDDNRDDEEPHAAPLAATRNIGKSRLLLGLRPLPSYMGPITFPTAKLPSSSQRCRGARTARLHALYANAGHRQSKLARQREAEARRSAEIAANPTAAPFTPGVAAAVINGGKPRPRARVVVKCTPRSHQLHLEHLHSKHAESLRRASAEAFSRATTNARVASRIPDGVSPAKAAEAAVDRASQLYRAGMQQLEQSAGQRERAALTAKFEARDPTRRGTGHLWRSPRGHQARFADLHADGARLALQRAAAAEAAAAAALAAEEAEIRAAAAAVRRRVRLTPRTRQTVHDRLAASATHRASVSAEKNRLAAEEAARREAAARGPMTPQRVRDATLRLHHQRIGRSRLAQNVTVVVDGDDDDNGTAAEAMTPRSVAATDSILSPTWGGGAAPWLGPRSEASPAVARVQRHTERQHLAVQAAANAARRDELRYLTGNLRPSKLDFSPAASR